jgi:hypothetical protein
MRLTGSLERTIKVLSAGLSGDDLPVTENDNVVLAALGVAGLAVHHLLVEDRVVGQTKPAASGVS